MALLIWYKLDSLNDNIGTNHLNYINNSGALTTYNYGKLGKTCYRRATLNNGIDLLRSTNQINLVGDFTMACWANVSNCHSGTANGLVTNHSHAANSGAGITVREISTTDYRISCNTGDSTNRTYHTYYGTTNIKDKWCHLLIKFEKSINRLSLWVNGIEEYSTIYAMYCISDYIDVFNWSTSYIDGANYRPASIIDDVRIYNHALSIKEIKELAKGKVLHFKLNNNLIDSSSFGFNGTVNDMLYDATPKFGTHCYTNDGSLRYFTVNTNPKILHDMTISMWVYPTNHSVRMNPYNKNYGGEGTITHETAGSLSFQWNHICLVKDITNNRLKWFINGVKTNEIIPSYPLATVSSSTLSIGTGYTSTYRGKIDDIRVYSTGLSDIDVVSLYNNHHSLDNNGIFHTVDFNETGFKKLKLDYTSWQNGQTNSIGMFNHIGNGAEDYRVLGNDPFGKQTVLWEARPSSDGNNDGGWNSTYVSIDNTKYYRFSVWIKRNLVGNGYTYIGLGDSGIYRINGAVDGNPYFYYTTNVGNSEWNLIVGHAFPVNSGIGSMHIDSGIYNINGKIGNTYYDYVWNSSQTQAYHRTYLYYCSDANVRQWWCYPRIDLIDGTEPSINELLKGFDSNNIDYIRSIGNRNLSLDATSSKSNVGEVSEIGITNGLVAYYPFDKDVRDYSGNNHHGTIYGNTIISNGLKGSSYYFDGVNSIIDIGIGSNYFPLYNFSVSLWFNSKGTVAVTGTSPGLFSLTYGIRCLLSSGNVFFSLNGNAISTSGKNYYDNTWHHLVCNTNGTTSNIYVDGILVTSGAAAWNGETLYPTNTFTIGRDNNNTMYYYYGYIDDFRIYNRVLSAVEVSILYELGNTDKKMKLTDSMMYIKNEINELY